LKGEEKMTKEEATKILKEVLGPGDTVHTILRHVSSSGMARDISLVVLKADSQGIRPFYADYHAATILELKEKNNGVRISGCGMDMGFALVYNLSRALWPDGFECIGQGCPSNDHVNREETSHHRDGGYALRQRWL